MPIESLKIMSEVSEPSCFALAIAAAVVSLCTSSPINMVLFIIWVCPRVSFLSRLGSNRLSFDLVLSVNCKANTIVRSELSC